MIRTGQRQSAGAALGSLNGRATDLERRPWGRWIYVGDFPTDDDTTEDSPPFENNWVNAGSGERRLRFRRTNENSVEIAGLVASGGSGAAAGSVVTTLPTQYRLSETEYAVGGSADSLAIWKFDTGGRLWLMGSATFPSGSDVDFLHWGTNTDDEAEGLSLQLGAGAIFTLLDSNGDPMLRMTDGSSDIHIPAGGSVIADL